MALPFSLKYSLPLTSLLRVPPTPIQSPDTAASQIPLPDPTDQSDFLSWSLDVTFRQPHPLLLIPHSFPW